MAGREHAFADQSIDLVRDVGSGVSAFAATAFGFNFSHGFGASPLRPNLNVYFNTDGPKLPYFSFGFFVGPKYCVWSVVNANLTEFKAGDAKSIIFFGSRRVSGMTRY